MATVTVHRQPTGRGYPSWIVVDNDASKPTTNLTPGSFCYASDTQKEYLAISATSWVELPSTNSVVNAISQVPLADNFPGVVGTPVQFSPLTFGSIVAYVFPFVLWTPLVLNQVAIRTQSVVSSCLILGIFDANGTQKWQSGALTTAAGWTKTTVNLPVTLAPGQYYFATTNNNSGSNTACYAGVNNQGSADMPRWGTVATTSGAMPASITPSAITKADLNFMIWVLLETWT